MDLHQKESQGFFNCPVDNLRASNFLIQYIQDSVFVLFMSPVISINKSALYIPNMQSSEEM